MDKDALPKGCSSSVATPAASTMPLKIGVMGGASDLLTREQMDRVHQLGYAIAKHQCVLITGACPGLPLAAACGAKQAGGLVVGISPGLSLEEHVNKYHSPTEFHDVLIYTGSGLMGREVVNIRSSDIVVIVGGRSGTLGELAIAYDEGKLIGVLTGTGGISDMVADILKVCAKETGSKVIYGTEPERLIDELLHAYRTAPRSGPTCYCADAPPGGGEGSPHNTTRDPVCGMNLVPQAAAAERTVAGHRYFFCSPACVARFDAKPQSYVSKEPTHA